MASPRISIVTPSFNQAEFVEYTIKSVVGQNYDNLEYIVIDGGSSDGSVDIIKRYRSQIRHFVSEPDAGHGNALNKGFRQSTGEIMGWLNSDDQYLPWTLRTVAEIFEQHPDIDWITGTPMGWNDKGAMLPIGFAHRNALDYLDRDYEWIQQESVFWRRRLWDAAGGYIDENYKLMVDTELWTRFFLHGYLWYAQCVLSGYRFHRNNRALTARDGVHAETLKAIDAMQANMQRMGLTVANPDYPILAYDVATSRWVKRLRKRAAKPQA